MLFTGASWHEHILNQVVIVASRSPGIGRAAALTFATSRFANRRAAAAMHLNVETLSANAAKLKDGPAREACRIVRTDDSCCPKTALARETELRFFERREAIVV
jgi:NAD(P)-dependent dehydrogenase (short-subunit alcohol dehydrogenase family)